MDNRMKPTSMMGPGERVWRVVYPVLIYFAAANIVSFLWMFAIEAKMLIETGEMNLILAEEQYMKSVLGMTCGANILTSAAAGFFYRRDLKRFKPMKMETRPLLYVGIAGLGVALSFSLNSLMNLIGVFEAFSDDYNTMAEALYGGPVWLEILTVVILAPLAEELIFRGLIFKRMRTYMTYLPAAIVSSLMFAFYHGNVLQGVYSFFLALMMTYLYEHFRTLGSVILFHGAANAFSVLVTEVDVINQWLSHETIYYGVMSVCMVGTIAGLYYMMEYFRKKEEIS